MDWSIHECCKTQSRQDKGSGAHETYNWMSWWNRKSSVTAAQVPPGVWILEREAKKKNLIQQRGKGPSPDNDKHLCLNAKLDAVQLLFWQLPDSSQACKTSVFGPLVDCESPPVSVCIPSLHAMDGWMAWFSVWIMESLLWEPPAESDSSSRVLLLLKLLSSIISIFTEAASLYDLMGKYWAVYADYLAKPLSDSCSFHFPFAFKLRAESSSAHNLCFSPNQVSVHTQTDKAPGLPDRLAFIGWEKWLTRTKDSDQMLNSRSSRSSTEVSSTLISNIYIFITWHIQCTSLIHSLYIIYSLIHSLWYIVLMHVLIWLTSCIAVNMEILLCLLVAVGLLNQGMWI